MILSEEGLSLEDKMKAEGDEVDVGRILVWRKENYVSRGGG